MLLDKIKDDPLCASFPNLGYTYLGGLAASASLSESQLTRSTTTSLNRSQPAVQTLLEPYIIPNQHSFIQSQLQSSHYLSSQYSTVPFSSGNLSVLSNGLNTVAASPYALHQSALVPSVQPSVYAGTTPPVGVLPATSFSRTFNGITAPSLVPTTVAHENGAMFQTNHLIMLSSNQAAGLMSPGYLTPSHQIFNASQGEESRANPVLSEIRLIASPTVSTPSTQPIAGLSNSVTPQSAVKILNTKKSLDGQFETLELAIPEAFIGAVLGKAGRTLIEFQDISGAKIRISKKGEYIVGSRNRKVTITGKPPCPQTAYMLLSKKVANAQELRLQSNLF